MMRNRKYQSPKLRLNRSGYLKVGFGEFFSWYKANGGAIEDRASAKKAFRRIMELVWYEIIANLWIMRLPYGLGEFYVFDTAKASASLYKDWKQSKIKNKIVRGFNANINGRKPYIRWKRNSAINSYYYGFRAFRGSKKNCTGYRGLWGYINSLDNKPYRPHII